MGIESESRLFCLTWHVRRIFTFFVFLHRCGVAYGDIVSLTTGFKVAHSAAFDLISVQFLHRISIMLIMTLLSVVSIFWGATAFLAGVLGKLVLSNIK
jgi:hypothetical protein